MADIEFAGFLFDALGVAVASATVDLVDRNTTTPVRATTTTDSNGFYTISHGTEGRFDIRITSGTNVLWRKYDTSGQMTELEVASLNIRNPADTFKYDLLPAAIVADRTLTLPLLTGTATIVVTPGIEDLDMGGFDIDNAGFHILNAATAPANTEVYLVHDNTGDLTLHALSGKTLNLAVAGTDEFVFSAASLDMNNNTLLNIGAAGNDWTVNRIIVQSSNSGGDQDVHIQNDDNTNTASHTRLILVTGGSSGGDPFVFFQVSGGGQVVAMGLDNTVNDDFTISDNATLGTNDRLRLVTATGVLSVDGAGAGDGLPTLFDDLDDTLELRTFQLANVPFAMITKEQQLENQRRLVEIGVAEWAIQDDDSYHWMMRIQPMMRLLAGGIWQTRERVNLNNKRIDALERGFISLKALIGG